MARVMPMLVVFLVVAMATKGATATDCISVAPCSNFLRDPKLIVPGSYCCNAAAKLIHLGDVDSMCQCLKPFTSGFLASQAQKLPQLCNLPGFSPLVPCLNAPSSEKAQPDTFLPPSFGHFPPIPMTPFGHFPPIPMTPFGPFRPIPMTPFGPFPPFHLPSFLPPPPPNKA